MSSWSTKCAYYVCRTNILSARKTASACRPPSKSILWRARFKRAPCGISFLAKVFVWRLWRHVTLVPENSITDAVELLPEKFPSKRFSAHGSHVIFHGACVPLLYLVTMKGCDRDSTAYLYTYYLSIVIFNIFNSSLLQGLNIIFSMQWVLYF